MRISSFRPSKIISGGQSGADRAALDFAIENNIPHGGFCPKERWAEDGRIPEKYKLEETESPHCMQRTEKNILQADFTLIVYSSEIDSGTRKTIAFCEKHQKPFLLFCLKEKQSDKQKFLLYKNANAQIINIAGPRASNDAGIYQMTKDFLEKL